MATVVRKVSDLSGAEAAYDAFVTVVVRKDDRTEPPVQLDALASEISGLDSAKGLVVHLQIKTSGGQNWESSACRRTSTVSPQTVARCPRSWPARARRVALMAAGTGRGTVRLSPDSPRISPISVS